MCLMSAPSRSSGSRSGSGGTEPVVGEDAASSAAVPAEHNSDFFLQVTKQPPLHAFVDDWFTVELSLNGNHRQSAAEAFGGGHLRLRADLHLHKKGMARGEVGPDVARLEVDSSTPLSIPLEQPLSKVSATIKCRINAAINSDSLLSVCIIFSPSEEAAGTNVDRVQNIMTQPIHLVNYKLSIEAQEWEKVWFKDEGGRDKCMQAQVSLCKRDDSPVYNLRVPLKLTLLYAASGQSIQVQKQDILRVLGPPKQFIDPDSSKTTVRFRIEDVSKNHQGQDFRVEVSADLTKFADVAPAETPLVSVRSKRNKRQRSGQTDAPTASDIDRSTPGAGSAHPPRGHPFPPHDMPVPGGGHFGPQSGPYRGQSMAPDRPQQALSDISDLGRLRDSMQGVIRWTEEVVNGLYPLQWQIIGYASYPDGTVDYSHPYHSMPNPNACISRILSMYSSSTREHLRHLMNIVEGTIVQQRQDLGSIEMGEVATAAAGHDFAAGSSQTPSSVEGARPMHLERGRSYEPYQHPHPSGPPVPQTARPFGQPDRPQVAPYSSSPRPGAAMHGPPEHLQRRDVDTRLRDIVERSSGKQDPGRTVAAAAASAEPQDVAEESEEIQAEVAYVLAKQYKALRTGERLGFPAFNMQREILGFYQESSTKVGVERFIPIMRLKDDFGPSEKAQARQILIDAIQSKSDAVHSIKDWGSVTNLVDNALVYDWSKNVLNASGSGSPSFP